MRAHRFSCLTSNAAHILVAISGRLTRIIGAAIAFFGLVLLAIIAYAGWSANETSRDRERTLVENALNESIARALSEQKSVAWWDDPILKITDDAIDLEFTDANFGIFLTETYAHDEVYILNAENRPLYAFAEGKRRDPAVSPSACRAQAVIDEDSQRETHAHIAPQHVQ